MHGEKLGTVNPNGAVFRTRSAALAQCASELVELAGAVYQIGLPAGRALSVRELADVFAAFRWGRLLRSHGISAMEFPYSVAGLTAQHLKMRWPDIDEPYAPDKPGTRFRMPFGAVPVVLSLGYRAIASVRQAGSRSAGRRRTAPGEIGKRTMSAHPARSGTDMENGGPLKRGGRAAGGAGDPALRRGGQEAVTRDRVGCVRSAAGGGVQQGGADRRDRVLQAGLSLMDRVQPGVSSAWRVKLRWSTVSSVWCGGPVCRTLSSWRPSYQ